MLSRKLLIAFIIAIGLLWSKLIINIPHALANSSNFEVGQEINGVLQSGDLLLGAGQYYDEYSFKGIAGQNIIIRLASPDYDAFLRLSDGDKQVIAIDDDAGEGTNAVISNFTLPATGTYYICATSREGGETGAYTLNLNSMPEFTELPTSTSIGESISGSLVPSDSQLDGQQYIDAYTFYGEPFKSINIQLTSADFDTYLWLLSNDGSVITIDDNQEKPSSTNSQIIFIPNIPATYTIWVSSTNPLEEGSYTLTLNTTSSFGSTASIDPGTITGFLVSSDNQLNAGQFLDIYRFNGMNNQSVNINLNSANFDTFLRLLDAQGNIIKFDDDSGSGKNSLISNQILPASGTYLIWASSVFRGNTGDYTLNYSISSASTGNISGQVTNSCSGMGIGRVTVTTNPIGYLTTSDAEGNYSLTNLAPGAYTLTTSSDKYDNATVDNVVVNVGGTDTADFALTTAHNPILDPIADISVTETQTVNFTASAIDEDEDILTYSITGWQCGGGIDGSTYNYTTTCDDSGVYAVTVRVDDGACGTDSQVVNINVLNKNKPPEVCTNPYPADGEIIGVEGVNLTWTGNGDNYDVYLNGELKCSNISETTCPTGALNSNTIYSWWVDSNNDCGTADGTNWSFSTGCSGGIIKATQASTWNTEAIYSVNVENTTNLAETFAFDLHYDPLVMEYLPSSEKITEQWGECIQNFNFLDIKEVEPGLIRVEGDSGSLPENSSCTIVNLAFGLVTGDTDLTCAAVTLADLTGGMAGWLACPGNICFNDCILGDIDRNNDTDVDDVLCLFEYMMGRSGCLYNVDVANYSCADVDQGGDVDIDDVFCLFRHIMGRSSCLDGI